MDDVLKLGFLGALQRQGIVPGLSRMQALMEAFGNPQLGYPVILITGTNGKGSTTCLVESILRSAGYRTGRFTSPHLVDVRERIQLEGRTIEQDHFDQLGARVRAVIESRDIRPTFFEALSAIGFLAFADHDVEVAVVEIGMGGRFDSTNVANPVLSVLTNVGLDHVGFLGSTREMIAMEKAGIAREGRPFVTGVDSALFESTVGPALSAVGARPVVRSGVDFLCVEGADGLVWKGWNETISGLHPGLPGRYQHENVGLALAAVRCLADSGRFVADSDACRRGVSEAFWPARFQTVDSEPVTILDGCHNVHAARSLKEELPGLSRPLILVHATRPEKDYDGVLAQIAPFVDGIIETSFEGGADPAVVANVASRHAAPGVKVRVEPDIPTAIRLGRSMAGHGGTVLVAGSLYMAGAAIRLMGWKI